MVDEIITRQELIDAKRDARDLGKAVNEKVIVSPRYGDDFKSIPMIAAESEAALNDFESTAQDKVNEWDSAINLITQESGVPALAVSTASGENQQDINDYNGAKWRNKAGGYNIGDRVKLNNGVTVESTVNSNSNNPSSDLTGWVAIDSSAYIKTKNPIAAALNRAIQNRFNEEVSIKDFGAIGDGTLHTLQEWVDSGKFSGLAAIQTAFPFVTSLTQSIDWCATQYAVKFSPNVFCPKGNYVLSDVVKTNHATTPRNIGVSARGVRIFGDGVQTTFSRLDARPATKILHNSGPYTTQASDLANLNEACFSIHSPFTIISDLAIGNSAVAFYFGQDFSIPFESLSSVAYSNIFNISISNCGTGLLMLAVGGNHYVNFSNIHFTNCQIDLDMRSSYWWGVTKGRGDANNNRNTFLNMRSDRSNIGTWIDCGDSNNFIGWRGESMPSAANSFPMPVGLPSEVVNGTLHVMTRANQLNSVAFGFAESVAAHVYNDGYENRFSSNGFTEDRVIMKQPPKEWHGRSIMRERGIGYADNAYSSFPEMPLAGALYLGLGDTPNGTRLISKDIWHQPKTNSRGSFEREFQIETGAISANTPVAFTIWGNVDASTSGMVELDVVGRCDVTGQTSTYIVKALANVYKASTRVPSRYSIHRIFASRSTSQGSGDTTESVQISTTLQINPSISQELQIVISCPQELTSATIFVKQKAAK